MPTTEMAVDASRITRFRRSLSRPDWRSLGGMAGFILLLHVIGFGVLFGLVVPQHFQLGGDYPIYTVGVGILAYTFGLRHAFDADHIAAVDNTTRKLMQDNTITGTHRKPLSVGFWFSLGHSTIVFALAFLLSVGVKALAGQVEDGGSELSNARPIAWKRNRSVAHNLLRESRRWFNFAKLGPDGIVTFGLLPQPLAKFRIAFRMVQSRAKLRIGIVDRSAIEKEDLLGFVRIHLACSTGKLVSLNRRKS